MKIGWFLLIGACVAALVAGGASATQPIELTGVTALSGGKVILYEGATGTAHQVYGNVPAVQDALVALAGHKVDLFGYFDQPSLATSPIRVDKFRVLPGGKFDGQIITSAYDTALIGPVRKLPDGGVILDDQYGNGHRLLPSDGPNAVSAATIASYVGTNAAVAGQAHVTNPSSYINWPITVYWII